MSNEIYDYLLNILFNKLKKNTLVLDYDKTLLVGHSGGLCNSVDKLLNYGHNVFFLNLIIETIKRGGNVYICTFCSEKYKNIIIEALTIELFKLLNNSGENNAVKIKLGFIGYDNKKSVIKSQNMGKNHLLKIIANELECNYDNTYKPGGINSIIYFDDDINNVNRANSEWNDIGIYFPYSEWIHQQDEDKEYNYENMKRNIGVLKKHNYNNSFIKQIDFCTF